VSLTAASPVCPVRIGRFVPTAVKPLAILVADDAPDIRELLTAWLTADGHQLKTASNGREAGELLAQQHFDLLITDVMMPEGDALALIKNAKHLRPGLSILAISGGSRYLEAEDCVKMAQALGAHATLLKPFSRAQLMEGIGRAVAVANAVNRQRA
jgi:DNA-binding NtrC family response regulator